MTVIIKNMIFEIYFKYTELDTNKIFKGIYCHGNVGFYLMH
jgi:hypothetical protein